MPGYDIAESDKKTLLEKYFCAHCDMLLRDAVQTSCGHFYCSSCLCYLNESPMSETMICRKDQKRLFPKQVFNDRFMRREVLALKVSCASRSNGCSWKGEVCDLEEHSDRCQFVEIPCVHCEAAVQRGAFVDHLTETCEYRLETCEWCATQIAHIEMKEHRDEQCAFCPILCDDCGGKEVLRGKWKQHRAPASGDCAGAKGPCPFAKIGCAARASLDPKERRRHLEEEHVHHVVLLFQLGVRLTEEMDAFSSRDGASASTNAGLVQDYESAIDDLVKQAQSSNRRADTLETLVQQQSERIVSLEKKSIADRGLGGNAGRRAATVPFERGGGGGGGHGDDGAAADSDRVRIIRLESDVANHEMLFVENNANVEGAMRDVANGKRRLDDLQGYVTKLERRMESIEHTLALRNVTLCDIEEHMRQSEYSTFNGELLWKIDDFARRRNDAVTGQQSSFYGPAFYTSRHGYKMCARVYLNGDGMGRGTHVSLFFVIMRGKYDALLRWPFRQKVTFMLLDQDNVEHVIDAFRPDPASSSYQRPKRETNIASGCPLFCKLDEMHNHAYVRDDVMFLKIIVDTSDL